MPKVCGRRPGRLLTFQEIRLRHKCLRKNMVPKHIRLIVNRGCDTKVAHVTYEKAELSLTRMSRRLRDSGLSIYLCGFCGYYHIGHPQLKYEERYEDVSHVVR